MWMWIQKIVGTFEKKGNKNTDKGIKNNACLNIVYLFIYLSYFYFFRIFPICSKHIIFVKFIKAIWILILLFNIFWIQFLIYLLCFCSYFNMYFNILFRNYFIYFRLIFICNRHDHYYFNCPLEIESPHSSVKSYHFIFFLF